MNSRKRQQGFLLNQDFDLLASRYDDFRQEWEALKGSSSQKSLSSKSTPTFQLALTRASLDFHFGLRLPSMPLDRLCPPVPNRWFYCEWVLSSLMPLLTNSDYFSSHIDKTNDTGLDIGTGASAIYPMLLTNHASNITMFASEIDPVSIDAARSNIGANKMQERIHLIKISDSDQGGGPLLQALTHVPSDIMFDFVVTNPPFFDQQPPPRKDGRDRTPMTDSEGIYPGGEEGWVLDILRDSLTVQRRIGWYTTMIAKKHSLQRLRGILLDLLGPGHVVSTELPSSTKITRWFLAWTYHRPTSQSPLSEKKPLPQFEVNLVSQAPHDGNVQIVAQRIKDYFESFHNDVVKCLEDDQSTLSPESLIFVEKDPVFPDRLMVETSSLPFDITDCKYTTKDWMPEGGHLWIKFQLCSKPAGVVEVQVKGCRHSQKGDGILENILRRLQGEVCRTNRRWRRSMARDNAK